MGKTATRSTHAAMAVYVCTCTCTCSLVPSLHCQLFFLHVGKYRFFSQHAKKKKLAVETGYEAMYMYRHRQPPDSLPGPGSPGTSRVLMLHVHSYFLPFSDVLRGM